MAWKKYGVSICIIWLDDASRYILAGGEFKEATIENTITFEKAMKRAREYNVEIKEVNTDKGSQFYSTKSNPSKFEMYLKKNKIKFIPSGRNNPQTNGKYDKHRFSFDSMEDFVEWYNARIGLVYENEWRRIK